jgi:DNA (cytosine-5)-methyltransferase 1
VNVLSLFAGIGGLDLGLERAGMTVVGQVEIDPFCQRVLARHWPEVPRHDDVRTAVQWWLGEPRPAVDVVAGGPPCQPASHAGRRLGVADPRWGWPWFLDVVRAVGPRHVVVENPAGILDLDKGVPFGWILGELANLRFDAEWSVLSACAMGAPHPRERLFLVANADRVDGQAGLGFGPQLGVPRTRRRSPAGVVSGAEARAWRDRVDRAVASAGTDDRNADGLAGRMVTAGGNAVVPQVAEHIGRLVMGAAA